MVWAMMAKGERYKETTGAYGSSTIYVSDQYRCLLCHPQSPLAARFKREHQWFTEAVLPERSRLVDVLASSTEQDRPAAQLTATGDLEIRNPSREI
jgi:hypothetical protein